MTRKQFTKRFVKRLAKLESCLEQLSEPGRKVDWREVADARHAATEMRLQFSEFFEVLSDRVAADVKMDEQFASSTRWQTAEDRRAADGFEDPR